MGRLYLVSTPIGNLEDLTARAARVLSEVDAVLAEDTRRTRKLLNHLGVSKPLLSLHAHNEETRAPAVLERLERGERLALVSDAGTPLVSDPGERLLAHAIEAGHEIVPIPGPSAVLAALVASGLRTMPFSFLGFVPRKGRERKAVLDRVAASPETIVVFESPERLAALLADLSRSCDHGRRAAVGREMTKLHEEFRRGTLEDLARYYNAEAPPKGEVTVVIAPAEGNPRDESEAAARSMAHAMLREGVTPSHTAREVATALGISRNRAYQLVQELQASIGTDGDSVAPGAVSEEET